MHLTNQLIEAIEKGNAPLVDELLQPAFAINSQITFGKTLLHFAASSTYPTIVALLLDKGADINIQDEYGDTPLHVACSSSYVREDIVALLLSKGAKIDNENKNGNMPLHCAAASGRSAVVTLLLDKGADIHTQNKNGNTTLHEASTHYEGVEVIKLLLNKGAALNSQNKEGNTPLHLAIKEAHDTILEQKLLQEISLNSIDLHKSQTVISLLVNENANINIQNKNGNTPLHYVAKFYEAEYAAELLLTQGAKLDIQNKDGDTPLLKAVLGKRKNIIEKFLRYGAYSYPNAKADRVLKRYWKEPSIRMADFPLYKALLLAGVDVQGRQLSGQLRTIQNNIELTVTNWLQPMHLPQATCCETAPRVCRILPRLMSWLELIQVENSLKIQDKSDAPQTSYATLLFKAASKEQINRSTYERLQAALPQEIMDLVENSFAQSELISPLAKFIEDTYELSYDIAQYLVNDAFSYPREYCSFYSRFFQHDWNTPCEPPVMYATELSKLSIG